MSLLRSFRPIRRLKQFGKADKGQTLVLTAVGLAVLMLMAGLGLDVGYLWYEKQQMQKAADAAALAGASALIYNGNWSAAAPSDAAANGFTNGVNGITVTVNSPPQTAGDPFYGQDGYVEVIVKKAWPTFFMHVGNFSSVNVSARAVASSLVANHGCLYALTPSNTGILVNGGDAISMPGCYIYDDSASQTDAMLVNGSNSLTAGGIGIVGQLLENGTNQISPTPTTGIASVPDPLSYLQPPPVPPACNSEVINGSGTFPLSPGCYSELIINGSATVNLSSGTYIVTGPLIFNGSGTINGTGVTFYLTSSATFNGSQTFNLSAPTSGTYNGILFFQARNDSDPVIINGANNTTLEGIFYFPAAQATFNGINSTNLYATVVCSSFIFNGNITIHDYALINPGTPLRAGTMVE